jgi:hypothetical protein
MGRPVLAAHHELAQDLDVVVLGVEQAFVEGLLERHHHRCDRARNRPSQARLQHWSSMSAVRRWNNRRRNASIADLPELRRLGGTRASWLREVMSSLVKTCPGRIAHCAGALASASMR